MRLWGGLSNHKGALIDGTDEEIRAAVRAVVEMAGRERFILGTDCTIPAGNDYRRLRVATDALEGL